MPKNRLQLDFSLELIEDRKNFLNKYVEQEQFKLNPLTSAELETCAKYLFYGKDENGTSCVSRGEVEVETKNKTWNNEQKITSLEALIDREEGVTFNEDMILKPYQAHYKNAREVFSRTQALNRAPDDLKPVFESLFKDIDETELLINYYDLRVGKRTKPPRQELLNRIDQPTQEAIARRAETINQYQYLKKKHDLVELRREQYTLRDTFESKIIKSSTNRGAPIEEEDFVFDCDIPVYPIGLFNDSQTAQNIFKPFGELIPGHFSEEELNNISDVYWDKQKGGQNIYFDFRDIEHVYQLFLQYIELKNWTEIAGIDNTTKFLFDTLEYYIAAADLSEVQKDILDFKVKKMKNSDIAATINKKYGKNYTANYISTIFRQKIIKQINEAAKYHEKVISNIFFPEEFKKCNCCGKTLLICSENFVKKSRSKDGYTNRCKKCDKLERQKKKGE